MSPSTQIGTQTPVDALLERGLYDLWYPICPSDFVKEKLLHSGLVSSSGNFNGGGMAT